jgi:hypothetical protein
MSSDNALICTWCSEQFKVRRGGSPQRFCSVRCRTAFWSAMRRWAERALAAGTVSIDALRDGRLEACTLRGREEGPPPGPEIGSMEQPSPTPLKEFLIRIPLSLINSMIFVRCELRHHEADDILALLTALARASQQPAITKTTEHAKLLSF